MCVCLCNRERERERDKTRVVKIGLKMLPDVFLEGVLHVCLMIICGKVRCIGLLSLVSNIRIYVQQ